MIRFDFLKASLVIVFFGAYSFVCAEPHIVVLKGTSCAGKSLVCNQILQNEKDEWRVIEEDSYLFKNYIKLISFYYPEESYAILHAVGQENFVHAILRGQVSFKPNISKTERSRVLVDIARVQAKLNEADVSSQVVKLSAKEIVSDIQDALNEGKNVIIDTPSPGIVSAKISKTLFPTHTVTSALLYCNLADTLKHLEERNKYCDETGDFSSKRYYRQVLLQFHNLYTITLIAESSSYSEDIATFHNIFEDLRTKVVPSWTVEDLKKFPRQEINLLSLSELEDKMFYYYPNMLPKTLYITPREKYDIIVNTGEVIPSVAAQQLISYLQQQ